MTVTLVSDASNVLAFPGETRTRPSVELIMELAPSRSLVDTLIAERGDSPHDAWAGFAREFAFQAQTLEIGHGRDAAIMRCAGSSIRISPTRWISPAPGGKWRAG